MPRSIDCLTLEEAKRMLSAAEAKAVTLGIAYNLAVVDAGGHLLAFLRQHGALIGSIELAIDKAKTAGIFDSRENRCSAYSKPMPAKSSSLAAAYPSSLMETLSAPLG